MNETGSKDREHPKNGGAEKEMTPEELNLAIGEVIEYLNRLSQDPKLPTEIREKITRELSDLHESDLIYENK